MLHLLLFLGNLLQAVKCYNFNYFSRQQPLPWTFDSKVDGFEKFDTTASTIKFERIGFESPKVESILFLPGLDGTGDFAKESLENISGSYNVWQMKISSDDRSRFLTISSVVDDFLCSFTEPVILVGESFGGLLAAHIVLRSSNKVSKLILLNPATSFDKTIWPSIGAVIPKIGNAYGLLTTAVLAATIVEPYQIYGRGQVIIDRINTPEDALYELGNMLKYPKALADALPANTLQWRLKEWLTFGSYVMEDKYSDITVPTLVIVGSKDRLLPSRNEGKRLSKLMTKASVEVIDVPEGGHGIFEGTIDLLDIISNSKIFRSNVFPTSTLVSSPSEIDLNFVPDPKDVKEADTLVNFLKKIASPVFLSVDKSGKIRRGMKEVPVGTSGRPVLFVGNHQLYGADMTLLVNQFKREKDVWIRGLAHPLIFRGVDGAAGAAAEGSSSSSTATARSRGEVDPMKAPTGEKNDPRTLLMKFGAVEVSPDSLFQLMRGNATVLLFPGGAKEAAHKKGEDYALFWPEKPDFIRMAAMFNAYVVPFAAIGSADSFEILLDGNEMLALPIVGKQLQKIIDAAPNVRPGTKKENILLPFSAPKLPARHYFLFQQPFDTTGLDVYNKKQCKQAYMEIRQSVSDGIELLKRFRENDPYREFFPRVLYETATGEQAPTTPLNSIY